MKITGIKLQNFRAYDEEFPLDLGDGKCLLLHGENGSGKSSMYFAMKRFFEERGDEISQHRNLFASPTRIPKVSVHLKGTDAQGNEHDAVIPWSEADDHPLRVPAGGAGISPVLRSLLVDASRRSGFLDYRTLLRTNLFAKPLPRGGHSFDAHRYLYGVERDGLEAQLFDISMWVILDGVRVTVPRGGETTIGTLIREVWLNRPESRHARRMERAQAAATRFNIAFAFVLPTLTEKIRDFLAYFTDQAITVTFEPVNISWSRKTLSLDGAVLVPRILFRDGTDPLKNFSGILNEARLSALAICMFLAGVRMSDNDDANPAHPRFLFLDDALVGLELQNRLPILNILTSEEFKHYQIFLFTHDRVWFELARGHLPTKAGWIHHELIGDESTGHLVPIGKPCEEDLEIAKNHLKNKDYKAAAVYARSAFEWKLRKVCESHGIKVPFKPDADKIGAGVLWSCIQTRQREREVQRAGGSVVPDFLSQALENEVEVMRSTVLNKLSHDGSSGLVHVEVAAALVTVKKVHDHKFRKIPTEQPT